MVQVIDTPSQILTEPTHHAETAKLFTALNPRGRPVHLRKLADNSQGNAVAQFDPYVKNQASVLTIVKGGNGWIFGGYFADSFTPGGSWVEGHASNFLFSLGAHGRGTPLKLMKTAGTGNGIHLGSCGLHLGTGGDMTVFCGNTVNKLQQFTTVAPGYAGPVTDTCLAGLTGAFNPTRMEVYQVTFPQ